MRESAAELCARIILLLGFWLVLMGLTLGRGSSGIAQEPGNEHTVEFGPSRAFLPVARHPQPTLTPIPCDLPGASYGSLSVRGEAFNAESHADLNLAMRGYMATNQPRSLVDYGGATDFGAPQLYGLFADNRTATFSSVYQVYQWDWGCNCRGGLISFPPVTLAGLATTLGEPIQVPDRVRGDIGGGYKVLVLYASENRITLKYTREDNVIYGYTLHLENICVEPKLLALYRTLHQGGRRSLPALYGGQALGRARSHEIHVVIRDVGSFMDPRSRKDWWQGR